MSKQAQVLVSPTLAVYFVYTQLLMMAGGLFLLWFGYCIDYVPEWDWLAGKYSWSKTFIVWATIRAQIVVVPLAVMFPLVLSFTKRKLAVRTCLWILSASVVHLAVAILVWVSSDCDSRTAAQSLTSFAVQWPLAALYGLFFIVLDNWYYVFGVTAILHGFRLFAAHRVSSGWMWSYTLICAASVYWLRLNKFEVDLPWYIHDERARQVIHWFGICLIVLTFGLALINVFRAWRARFASQALPTGI